jgi:hypothetical protein
MLPVSPTAIGVGLSALSLVGLFCYHFLASVSELEVAPDSIYFFLGMMLLGVGLIGWDRLTDYFEAHETPPSEF